MNEDLRRRLLGSGLPDPGCEPCFDVLDQYAEALARGEDVTSRFAELVAHLASCPACREDAEGLLAALAPPAPPEEPK